MDIVVLSHLRWDFVWQRPQHLLSRAARSHRVLFVEEPVPGDTVDIRIERTADGVEVARPHLPPMPPGAVDGTLAVELRHAVRRWQRPDETLVVWHYSVMAEPWTRLLDADVTVFDRMDDLAAFRDAPPELAAREAALMERADVVFTGGLALWEATRDRHANVHCFPSSVDVRHFARARAEQPEPEALRGVGRPRLAYAGVIDERVDLRLVHRLARADIGEVVLVGPIAKIDPNDVPRHPRIHQLGMQPYDALPAVFAHVDVGLMPFALNEATRSISPTKTPEYLAAGLPVVSTGVRDVERAWGDLRTVTVAHEADAFVEACRDALRARVPDPATDARLATMSWDRTWSGMEAEIEATGGRTAAA